MSSLWWFYSYDPVQFAATFDGSMPDAAGRVAAAADVGAWRDAGTPARVAARITAGGLRYDGLSAADAAALDLLLPMLFATEGWAMTGGSRRRRPMGCTRPSWATWCGGRQARPSSCRS